MLSAKIPRFNTVALHGVKDCEPCFTDLGESISIWDAQTGQELVSLKGHSGRVWSVAFSPDSKRLASGSEDQTVKVWDTQTGQELLSLKGHTGAV